MLHYLICRVRFFVRAFRIFLISCLSVGKMHLVFGPTELERSSFGDFLLEFFLSRYPLNCHPWLWPTWFGGKLDRSKYETNNTVAEHNFHLHHSRNHVNTILSDMIDRGKNTIYSGNPKKTDTKASILLNAQQRVRGSYVLDTPPGVAFQITLCFVHTSMKNTSKKKMKKDLCSSRGLKSSLIGIFGNIFRFVFSYCFRKSVHVWVFIN